jgi:hypothetical protein
VTSTERGLPNGSRWWISRGVIVVPLTDEFACVGIVGSECERSQGPRYQAPAYRCTDDGV